MMKLPVAISPNPLVTSTIEIRFFSDVESDKVLTTFFPIFSKELPILKEGKIPKELRNHNIKELMYAADFSLSNDEYSISFSNKAVSFEVVGEYKYWNNYSKFIREQIDKLIRANIIKDIQRIGVRYASVFAEKKIANILQHFPSLNMNGYDETIAVFRTNLLQNDNQLHLQIANNARVNKGNKSFSGTVIDIDSFSSAPISPDLESVFNKVDELHLSGKELFFKLLRPDFLQTLNPKY